MRITKFYIKTFVVIILLFLVSVGCGKEQDEDKKKIITSEIEVEEQKPLASTPEKPSLPPIETKEEQEPPAEEKIAQILEEELAEEKTTEQFDLSQYPYPFVKDNTINTIVVVGRYASSTDVNAMSDIIAKLQQVTETGAVDISKTASEVEDYKAQNVIFVGSPCTNALILELMGKPSDCTEGFEIGKGVIKLYDFGNGNTGLLVGGNSNADINAVANVLANYEDYSNILKGREVIVAMDDVAFNYDDKSIGKKETIKEMIIFREKNPGEIFLSLENDRWDINRNKFLEQFYQIYGNDYDFIALFPTKKMSSSNSLSINFDISGIGLYSKTKPYTKRLKSLLALNYYFIWKSLDNPPLDEQVLLVFIHETGHHWATYVKGFGLSSGDGHWVHNLDLFNGDSRYVDITGYRQWVRDDSKEICVDGNDKTVVRKFSDLTLYLMGLIPKEQVKPIYVHDFEEKPGNSHYNTWGPNCIEEHEFLGTKTVTIDDIIDANGERIPSYENSQKDFTMVFVILTDKDTEVPSEFIDYINEYKEALPNAWNDATNGRSTIITKP